MLIFQNNILYLSRNISIEYNLSFTVNYLTTAVEFTWDESSYSKHNMSIDIALTMVKTNILHHSMPKSYVRLNQEYLQGRLCEGHSMMIRFPNQTVIIHANIYIYIVCRSVSLPAVPPMSTCCV